MIKRTIHWKDKYDCTVKVIDSQKLIYWIDCTCADFIHRKLKKVGENSDIKIYSEPCKHLKKVIDPLIRMGYKLKKPKEIIGPDKLTTKIRQELLNRAQNQCEDCGSTDLLQIHRKTRGSNGGKYNLDNCVVLCKECHRARHQNEFSNNKSY
jgi:hypothetical protein